MLQLLRTRRWISFTALVIAAIVGFGLLSNWQWHRAEERRTERIAMVTAASAEPLSLADVDPRLEFAPVDLEGTYRSESTRLVRSRPLGGGNGYWVMTYLDVDPFTGAWVNRGWLAATLDASTAIAPPAPPVGTVEIHGFTRAFEESGTTPSDLPAGQVSRVSLKQLPPQSGAVSAFWVQSASTEAGLTNVPLPEVDEGRNISYAMQWLIFAVVAMGGWYVFLRREARAEDQSEAPN